MPKDNSVFKAIQMVDSGQKFPALSLVSSNPEMAALLSKLNEAVIAPTYGNGGKRQLPYPNHAEFQDITKDRARAINDSQTVMQMLPDIELCAQILISSILSPKDMMAGEMILIPPENVLNSSTSAALIQELSEHFSKVYKIQPELGKILRNVLFEKGSHVVAVIPENSLDELINRSSGVTMESIREFVDETGRILSLGILGARVDKRENKDYVSLSLEDFKEYNFKTNISPYLNYTNESNDKLEELKTLSVTDNISILKFPQLKNKIRSDRVNKAISKASGNIGSLVTSLESAREAFNKKESLPNFNDRELTNLLYKGRATGHVPISVMKTDEQLARRSVGSPLVMTLPSESVIPVHMPGNPKNHIGYFVMLDVNGNPVNKEDNKDYYSELSGRLGNTSMNSSAPSNLIQRLKSGMQGWDAIGRDHIDYSTRVYAELIEQDLIARLKNGVYNNGVALARNEEVYRIMLARTLSSQQTQLLFIPVELVTYFAFKYNDNGTGKSLLEDMQILNTLRATVMFSNVMASVRNSIGRTTVGIKFDEDDPDPTKTAELMMAEVVKSRGSAFPVGASNPVDIVSHLQRAALDFNYEGHSGMPDVKTSFTDSSSQHVKPDTELEKMLKDNTIQGLGLSPDMLDASNGAEFATAIANNNVLLSRRVMNIQDEFTPQIMDNVKKIINATPHLIDKLTNIIESNFEDNQSRLTKEELQHFEGPEAKKFAVNKLLFDFIEGTTVRLPRPNTVTLENQEKSFDTYVNMLEKVLDSYISEKFFTSETSGAVASNVGVVKEIVKAYFIRQWLSENGVMPELSQITALDEDGKPSVNFWEDHTNHIENLTNSLSKFMTSLQTSKAKSDQILNAAGVVEGSTSSSGGDSSFDSSNTGDTGGSDDGFGLGDMGGDNDNPTDDTVEPTASEPTTDDTQTNPEKKEDKTKNTEQNNNDSNQNKTDGDEDVEES